MIIQKPFKKTQRVTVDCGPGLTEQAHKDECDMNYILRDYVKTGLIRHAAKYAGQYDDVTGVDFQKAMMTVKGVEQLFQALPAQVRTRFNGDPAGFLDFVQNPANAQEMAKLGLLKGNDGLTFEGLPSGAPVVAPAPAADPVSPPAAAEPTPTA